MKRLVICMLLTFFMSVTSVLHSELKNALEKDGLFSMLESQSVVTTVSCVTPSNLSIYRITYQSAELMWVADEMSLSYNLKVSTTAMSDMSVTADVFDGVVYWKPYTLSGLNASTTYYFYVKSECDGGGQSQWSEAGSFTTSCSAVSTPLSESFDSYGIGAGTFPSCWTKLMEQSGDWGSVSASSTYTPYCNDYTKHNGAASLCLSTYYSNLSSYSSPRFTKCIAATPALLDTISILQVDFWAYSTSTLNKLHVGVMTDPTDVSTFEEQRVIQMSTASTWEAFSVTFSTNQNGGKYIAFMVDAADRLSASIFYLDDVFIEPISACPKPLSVQLTASDSTSLTIGWTATNATSWNVKASTVPMSNMSLTADGYDGLVHTNPATITGLLPNTSYYVYVQSDCATDSLSRWSNEMIFTTPCAVISTLPYDENFDDYSGSGSMPPCWTKSVSNNYYPSLSTNKNHTVDGVSSLYFSTNASGSDYNIVASPMITTDSIKNLSLSFYAYYSTTGSYIQIGVMTNPVDTSTFVLVDNVYILEASTWNYIEVDLSGYTGNGRYIAFKSGGGSLYNSIFIDDVHIEESRRCEQPKDLSVTRLTSDGGRLSWSTSALALYNVKVSSSEINPNTTTADIIELSQLQDAYITLTELASNTSYYFYVQADCGLGDTSYWSDGYQFTTLCDAQSIPYVENFKGYVTGVMPDCWSTIQEISGVVTGSFDASINRGTFYGTDSVSLEIPSFYSKSISGETVTIRSVKNLVSLPLISNDLNGLAIRFNNYCSHEGSKLSVGIMTDIADISTFEVVDTIVLGSWQQSTVSFENYHGQAGYITFMVDGAVDEYSIKAYIAQIRLDSITSCQIATSLDSRYVTVDGAELYWGSLSAADSVWHVQVSEFDAGYDVDKLDSITLFDVDTIVHGNSLVVTGLDALTSYYYYVRPLCADGSDGPRYPITKQFRTACGYRPLPYSESFDTYGTGVGKMVECWEGYSTYTIVSYPYLVSTNNSSPASLYLYSSNNTYTYAVMPEFDIDSLKRLQLSFMARTTSTIYNLQIGVMSDPSDLSTFDSLTTITFDAMNQWYEINYALSNYTGDGKYIVFLSDRRNKNGYNAFFIDDVLVQFQPTCFRPTSLSVSNITQSSATFSWPSHSNESSYDLAIVPNGGDPDAVTSINVDSLSYTASNLEPSSTYQVYVRSNCGGGDVSVWRGPIVFNTLQVAASLPFLSTFDSNNDGWSLENGEQMNQFFIGNAVKHSGSGSLYISNSNGVTHNYDITNSSVVYAYRLINFTPGTYVVSYDWLGQGESTFDFARVYLAPNTADVTAGINVMSSVATSVQSDWLLLDNGRLNLQETWQHVEKTITITKAANYYVIIGWRNDAKGGSQPPIAIDNFRITEDECYSPFLVINSMLDTTASLSWAADADSVEIKISSNYIPIQSLDTAIGDIYEGVSASPTINVQGLTASTTYYTYIRSYCRDGDTTAWVDGSFMTDCAAVLIYDTVNYSNGFDTYGTMVTSDIPCWRLGTNFSIAYPQITTESKSSPYSLHFYGTSSYYSYAATPRIEGTSVKELRLNFNGYQSSTYSYILVGIIRDVDDITTFEMVDSISCEFMNTWENFTVYFNKYEGDGNNIAFKVGGYGSVVHFYLDDLVIEALPQCSAPLEILPTEISDSSMYVSWESEASDTLWEVKVYSSLVDVDLFVKADVIDTMIHSSTMFMDGLSASSTYKIYIRKWCSQTDIGNWLEGFLVNTNCNVASLPYRETFENRGFPSTCWNKMDGLLGESMYTSTSGWKRTITEVLEGGHAYMTYSGSNHGYWLLTPQLSITAPSILSFDLALTDASNTTPIENFWNQPDDRFIVIVSTDNGATWDTSHMVVWNDEQGDYGFSSIPYTGAHYWIDLSNYVGQDILVGFYGETTIANASNDLHLDNVIIKETYTRNVSDTVCQGSVYREHGFAIEASVLGTPGNVTFRRLIENDSRYDTLLNLNLYVKPTLVENYNVTICSGDVYSGHGFSGLTISGAYTRDLDMGASCDRVILNLTVTDEINQNLHVSACESELPYVWQDMNLNIAGVYGDTLVSAYGCDSILTLTLHVLPEYNVTDRLVINDTDLPYHYMDTVFTAETPRGETTHLIHGSSVDGCDSIVTLTLNILSVGVTELGSDYFEVYPNPISVGEEINVDVSFMISDLEGTKVEVFNSIGECVKTIHPTELQIRINGFAASGIYVVRIITKSNRIFYGKVIVR